jgi:hypothetical protein
VLDSAGDQSATTPLPTANIRATPATNTTRKQKQIAVKTAKQKAVNDRMDNQQRCQDGGEDTAKAGAGEAEATALGDSEQTIIDEGGEQDGAKRADRQSNQKTGGYGKEDGVTGIAGGDAGLLDEYMNDEDDDGDESVVEQSKKNTHKTVESRTKKKYAPEKMTKKVVDKLTAEEVHITKLNQEELNEVIEIDDDDVRDAQTMIQNITKVGGIRLENEEELDGKRTTKRKFKREWN